MDFAILFLKTYKKNCKKIVTVHTAANHLLADLLRKSMIQV